MLKKEFIDALKRLTECLFVLVGIPLGYLWDRLFIKFGWEFWGIFKGVFIATVFIYAAYSGATIFLAEKKDRAFEYLLSLPVSKTKIFFSKLLPRISLLITLYLILLIFIKAESYSTIGFYLLLIFLISVFISIAIDSAIIGFFGIVLLIMLYNFIQPTIFFMAWKYHVIPSLVSNSFLIQLISAILFLTPFGLAFWKIFKNLDAKPLKLQLKPYYSISLPSLLIMISLILKFYRDYLAWMRKK